MKRAQALVTALHEITFSTNHSERVLLRPQHKLTPEGPIASLATKMTPLEFPFRAFEEKDGPPPLRPQLAAPRVTPEASGRVLTLHVFRIGQLTDQRRISLLARLRCEMVNAAL